MTAAERRFRIGRRHRVATSSHAESPEAAAHSMLALHATDPATVHLSVSARMLSKDRGALERALYDDRTLVRMHGMRRTVFVVERDLVPIVHASSTQAVAARERTMLLRILADGGLDERWLEEVQGSTLRVLGDLGEAVFGDLAVHEPRLREQIVVAPGRRYGAAFAAGSRLLTYMAMQGLVVRRRPVGGWTSNRFRWALAEPMPHCPPEVAQACLTTRWLETFGPAPAQDLAWWTGWRQSDVRRALATVGAREVDLDGQVALVAPGDEEPVGRPDPWVALLPALDPTAMGWQRRDWYLPEDWAPLFDRSGNIGPTVWSDGRIVGGWAVRAPGEVVWRALCDVGSEVAGAVDEAAHDLARQLGDTVVTPRFRTPLERQIRG